VTISLEILLVLGVIGFYTLDSAMLLYSNELVFLENDNHWNFVSPNSKWHFLRKRLYIPNLLSPDTAQFRVFWSSATENEQVIDEESLVEFSGSLSFIRLMVMLLLILFFLELPLVLFWFHTDSLLIVLFGFIYFCIFTMLVHIFRNRKKLALSKKNYFLIAFEAIACPPFAINVLRRITLNRFLADDPVEFAREYFDEDKFQRVKVAVCTKIDERLGMLDFDDPRFSNLQDYRDRIRGMQR
jgi:hypothetical protein